MEEATSKSVSTVVILPYKRKCNPKCAACKQATRNDVDSDDDVIFVDEQPAVHVTRVSERFRFRRIRRIESED